jgi:hypothetical protein
MALLYSPSEALLFVPITRGLTSAIGEFYERKRMSKKRAPEMAVQGPEPQRGTELEGHGTGKECGPKRSGTLCPE